VSLLVCVTAVTSSRFLYVYLACDAATQFRCGSGECKSLCKRCDGQVDCIDSSDEFNCSMLLPSGGIIVITRVCWFVSL